MRITGTLGSFPWVGADESMTAMTRRAPEVLGDAADRPEGATEERLTRPRVGTKARGETQAPVSKHDAIEVRVGIHDGIHELEHDAIERVRADEGAKQRAKPLAHDGVVGVRREVLERVRAADGDLGALDERAQVVPVHALHVLDGLGVERQPARQLVDHRGRDTRGRDHLQDRARRHARTSFTGHFPVNGNSRKGTKGSSLFSTTAHVRDRGAP
jgi:hypothetical protein